MTSLDLSYSSFGNTGASRLSQAIKANYSLNDLNLSINSIGYAGASSLSEALTANSSLTLLDLNDNSISDAGAGKWMYAYKRRINLISVISKSEIKVVTLTCPKYES